jgi:aryl-alcohol dehydrogenase-like predicted oxidoreductase
VTTVQLRKLGPFGVYPIGLGAMPFSMGDNERPTVEQAVATVHAALDAGVTFIDTADIYAPSWDTMGHNEEIVAKALASYGSDVDHIIVGTKGGITRGPGETDGRDGSITYLRRAVEASLRALRRDTIDLYQWHRPDRSMVYGEAIANFKTLQDEGKIRAIGISNANVEEIDVAVEVLGRGGLASVQNEFSPRFRCSRDELEHCADLGVAFLPWSPLGGTGKASKSVGDRYTVFRDVGAELDVSPQQVVLAWELSLGDHVIPIPGASRPQSIVDSVRAASLELGSDRLDRIRLALAD